MARRKDGTRRGTLPLRIIPNKNRRRQLAPTSRRLFDDAAKAEFLEWFAATCNASLSARKTGFHYRTALRHWREDASFGRDCEAALRMGYVRLEELALRSAAAALSQNKRCTIRGDRPAPPETFAMDASVALQLLREHKLGLAGLTGGSGRGAKRGRAPAAAPNAEVLDALVKRLRAFGIRVSEEEAQAGAADGAAAANDNEAGAKPGTPSTIADGDGSRPREERGDDAA